MCGSEPTTGLDSTTSFELVAALRAIASHRHVNVAAVVHQPSAKTFASFDDVLLLGSGGATVYLGPSSGALAYFSGLGFAIPPMENPADFFLDVILAKVPSSSPAFSGGGGSGSGGGGEDGGGTGQLRRRKKKEKSSKKRRRQGAMSWQQSREFFTPSLLTEAWERAHPVATQPQPQPQQQQAGADEETGGGAAASSSSSSSSFSASLSSSSSSSSLSSQQLGWRDVAALVETQLPSDWECFSLLLNRAVIEHMRFPVEFFYELLLELFTGFVVGSLYSNFTFHDLQQVNK